MRYELIAREPKTYVLIFETGDELAAGLKKVAAEAKLSSSSFKAIGALSRVKLGWFNWKTKTYEPAVVLDEMERRMAAICWRLAFVRPANWS
jgi:hypothetical protein